MFLCTISSTHGGGDLQIESRGNLLVCTFKKLIVYMAEGDEETYVEVGKEQIAPEREPNVVLIDAPGVASEGSGVFLDRLAAMMHHGNISEVIKEQEKMLLSLEVSNEKLTSYNNVSEATFRRLSGVFVQNTKLLADMKKELDTVFRRIRFVMQFLAKYRPL